MSKNKLLSIVSLMILVLILGACGSDKNNKTNNEDITNTDVNEESTNSTDNMTGESEYEQNLEEADSVAREVLEAFMTVDYNRLYDMASDSLKEQLEGNLDNDNLTRLYNDFDKDNSPLVPHGVSLHDDYYGFERYDTLYNEEHGIYWYGIEVISPSVYTNSLDEYKPLLNENYVITDDFEMLQNISVMPYQFGVRKENEDWEVGVISLLLDSQPLINGSEADIAKKNKVVIHELVPNSKLAEVYGDMSDVGF